MYRIHRSYLSGYMRLVIFNKVHMQSIRFVTKSNILKRRLFSSLRGQYSLLTDKDIKYFQTLLTSSRIIQEPSELEMYNTDWLRSHKGSSKLVLRPKTSEEVSEVLKYCYKQNLAVCPQGGNTGLVGGSIPIFDEVVISMSLMNKVLQFDDNSGILQCQAGCILENLEKFVNDKNYTMPVDLGAKGSCQIGGNISTNAGGLRFVRYGSLHGNILGLKVVLANGETLDCMNTMRKNNTGYDLKHLFIGSEGTLGIITEAAILCYPKSSEVAVAFLGCVSFEKVLSVAKVIRKTLSDLLSSLEMLDNQAADSLRDNLKISLPIKEHPFYILVEISGSNAQFNEEQLNNCLNILMNENLINDGTVTTEPSHIKNIWAVRERITESLLLEGCGYKYDISLPLSDFYEIVEVMRKRLGNKVTRCVAYGHLGDGNLHFNATTREFSPDVLSLIEPFIYEWISKRNGSISAEHGIGYKKSKYLHFNKTKKAIDVMKSLKQMLDPKGILNPYKVIPDKFE